MTDEFLRLFTNRPACTMDQDALTSLHFCHPMQHLICGKIRKYEADCFGWIETLGHGR